MDKLKTLLKNEKEIIEGFFISILTAWGLTSIFRGTYGSISSLDGVSKVNFPMLIVVIGLLTIIVGIVYYKEKFIAKILMFFSVYIYAILCAISGYKVTWETANKNEIGNVCFLCMLCFITVLAFLYIKDEVIQMFGYMKLNRKISNILFAIIGISLFIFISMITILRYKSYSNSTYDFGKYIIVTFWSTFLTYILYRSTNIHDFSKCNNCSGYTGDYGGITDYSNSVIMQTL